LAKHQFEKVFKPEEANALIPQLQAEVRAIQIEAAALRERMREVADADSESQGLSFTELIERYPELRAKAEQMAELASRIEGLGCFLKDIELGLVDFPCELDGDAVFLCWQFGEPEIAAWHPIDSGFTDRRPLPGVAKPYLN
jgi:hypothetical protein